MSAVGAAAPPAELSHREIMQASKVAGVSAAIAGDLYRASLIARQLALAAQNSRTMVARVGERAAGLDVLSEYFAQLSRDTIKLSRDVNTLATRIANNSVARWRIYRLLQALSASRRLNSDSQFHNLLDQRTRTSRERAEALSEQFRKVRGALTDKLSEMETHMRSASVLAVNFRLEATKTGEFEKDLRHMAADIESRSEAIGEHASRSIARLRDLRKLDEVD